jgi:hypothetical protein
MNVRKTLSLLLIGVLLMAWLSGWGFRKKITVQNTYIDSNLTDFPTYIFINADGDFHEARSDGYDIRFTQSDGQTLLKYERLTWSGGGGSGATARFWVKIPSLLASGTNEIYVYYGKSDATDGEDATNVWDSNFKAVYHMNDLTTSTIKDSTATPSNGTKSAANEPVESTGRINKAQDFDGADDYIDCGSASKLDDIFDGGGSISCWYAPDSYGEGGYGGYMVVKHGGGDGFLFYVVENRTRILGYYQETDGGSDGEWSIVDSITWGTWHHVAVVYDADDAPNNDPLLYLDGSSRTVTQHRAPAGTRASDAGRSLNLGGEGTAQNYEGDLEEIRLSTNMRSAEWLKFEYYNVNESDNELTWASEEASSGDQTLIPTAIPGAEAFGTHKLNLRMFPAQTPGAEAFGTHKLNLRVFPAQVPGAEAFGTHQLNVRIFPAQVPGGEAFGTLLVNAQQTLVPDEVAGAEAFGLSQLNLRLLLSSVPGSEAFGTHQLNLRIFPAELVGGEAFGNTTVNAIQTLIADAIASLESVGEPVVLQIQALLPTAISSGEGFGITQLNMVIFPAQIAGGEAFGTTKLNYRISPTAIPSEEGLGAPRLNLRIFPSAVASSEAFGTLLLTLYILPTAIPSAEGLGEPELIQVQAIQPLAVASLEGFGTTKLNLRVFPSSVLGGEAFGTPLINAQQTLIAQAIASLESLGAPQLNLRILVNAIASGEAFGVLTVVLEGDQTIYPVTIASAEAFGNPTVFKLVMEVLADLFITMNVNKDLFITQQKEEDLFITQTKNFN